MDFDFAPAQQRFRSEVRAWLAAHVPDDLRSEGASTAPSETSPKTEVAPAKPALEPRLVVRGLLT